jgi:uncharacterized circularly permuted ATP-grasp superfamily protein
MFDEMNDSASSVRPHYEAYQRWLAKQPADAMQARRAEAEMIFRRVGITFAVYGDKDEDGAGTERLIPFDLIPRIIPAHEWASMEKGLVQRVTALNRFIHDVYHGQDIIKAGVVPAEQIFQNAQFRPEMMGVDVPGHIYSHISGIDIVRAPNAQGEGELHARRSQDDDAAVPRTLQPEPGRPRRALSRLAAGNPAPDGAAGHGRTHGGGAHARHVQLGLL